MAAPERFAQMSDSSCTAGAVHTWPIASLIAMQQFFRSWGHSGHDTSTVARRGPPRASPSSGRRTHPEIGQKLHRPAKGGNGEASAKSRRVNQFSVFVFGLPHSPAPREGFWKGFNFSLSFFWSTRVDNADAAASLARGGRHSVCAAGTPSRWRIRPRDRKRAAEGDRVPAATVKLDQVSRAIPRAILGSLTRHSC